MNDRQWKVRLADMDAHGTFPAPESPELARYCADLTIEEMLRGKLDAAVSRTIMLGMTDIATYMSAVAADPEHAERWLAALGQSVSDAVTDAVMEHYIEPDRRERERQRPEGYGRETDEHRAADDRERASDVNRA